MDGKRTAKKRRFYDCANHEFEYDDLGKFHWCHARIFGESECICGQVWSMQYCPCYKKGKLRGTFEVSKFDEEEAENFKKEIAKRKNEIEATERAEYERLKRKYG